jgi:hypothetical protein
MSEFIFLLRTSTAPLPPEQIEERTQKWRALITDLSEKGFLVAWQVFENKGVKITGPERTVVQHHPVIEYGESVGGAVTIEAASLDEAIELSKRCPVLDYGGSVEVRPLQPLHNRLNIPTKTK